MAFDPNKDIKIEASETSAGLFALRTKGLADRRRAELEITGVPEVALHGAAGVINLIAGYTVNKAEVLADQTVGVVLAVDENARRLLVVVRAVVAERPAAGLWSKITGGGRGVLRLVDIVGRDDAPPHTALATMLVHRAALRRTQDDEDGARTELEAAVATFPGVAGAGDAPSIADAGGAYNWQNHLAHLDLAVMSGDVEEATAHYERALARSDDLARGEIGATLDEVAAFVGRPSADIAREATRITEHNLSSPEKSAGPTPALVMIGSPIWERTVEGRVARRTSLMPAALVSIYYGPAQAERLLASGSAVVSEILAHEGMTAAKASWIARDTRRVWLSDEAPLLPSIGPVHAAHGLVSSVLADVARCVRAGATDPEIVLRYTAGSESVDKKLDELAVWEGEQYIGAMTL